MPTQTGFCHSVTIWDIRDVLCSHEAEQVNSSFPLSAAGPLSMQSCAACCHTIDYTRLLKIHMWSQLESCCSVWNHGWFCVCMRVFACVLQLITHCFANYMATNLKVFFNNVALKCGLDSLSSFPPGRFCFLIALYGTMCFKYEKQSSLKLRIMPSIPDQSF